MKTRRLGRLLPRSMLPDMIVESDQRLRNGSTWRCGDCPRKMWPYLTRAGVVPQGPNWRPYPPHSLLSPGCLLVHSPNYLLNIPSCLVSFTYAYSPKVVLPVDSAPLASSNHDACGVYFRLERPTYCLKVHSEVAVCISGYVWTEAEESEATDWLSDVSTKVPCPIDIGAPCHFPTWPAA